MSKDKPANDITLKILSMMLDFKDADSIPKDKHTTLACHTLLSLVEDYCNDHPLEGFDDLRPDLWVIRFHDSIITLSGYLDYLVDEVGEVDGDIVKVLRHFDHLLRNFFEMLEDDDEDGNDDDGADDNDDDDDFDIDSDMVKSIFDNLDKARKAARGWRRKGGR